MFAELFYGKKRWFLYPPNREGMPPFDPNMSSLQWVATTYQKLLQDGQTFDTSSFFESYFPGPSHALLSGGKNVPVASHNSTHTRLPLECTLEPGIILWIPDRWWHSTLNIGETVFISAFV